MKGKDNERPSGGGVVRGRLGVDRRPVCSGATMSDDKSLRDAANRKIRDIGMTPDPTPPEQVHPRKGRKFPPHVLTPDECEALLRSCASWTHQGRRGKAAIALLWRCGLRATELTHLYKADVDILMGTLRVRRGKGNKYRIVGMDTRTIRYLADYLEGSPERVRQAQFVFPNKRGGPWSYTSFWKLIRFTAVKAGLQKRVHPHAFRHTFASELRQEGVDIGVISKALGHENIATTAIYLDHVMPLNVINQMKKRRW